MNGSRHKTLQKPKQRLSSGDMADARHKAEESPANGPMDPQEGQLKPEGIAIHEHDSEESPGKGDKKSVEKGNRQCAEKEKKHYAGNKEARIELPWLLFKGNKELVSREKQIAEKGSKVANFAAAQNEQSLEKGIRDSVGNPKGNQDFVVNGLLNEDYVRKGSKKDCSGQAELQNNRMKTIPFVVFIVAFIVVAVGTSMGHVEFPNLFSSRYGHDTGVAEYEKKGPRDNNLRSRQNPTNSEQTTSDDDHDIGVFIDDPQLDNQFNPKPTMKDESNLKVIDNQFNPKSTMKDQSNLKIGSIVSNNTRASSFVEKTVGDSENSESRSQFFKDSASPAKQFLSRGDSETMNYEDIGNTPSTDMWSDTLGYHLTKTNAFLQSKKPLKVQDAIVNAIVSPLGLDSDLGEISNSTRDFLNKVIGDSIGDSLESLWFSQVNGKLKEMKLAVKIEDNKKVPVDDDFVKFFPLFFNQLTIEIDYLLIDVKGLGFPRFRSLNTLSDVNLGKAADCVKNAAKTAFEKVEKRVGYSSETEGFLKTIASAMEMQKGTTQIKPEDINNFKDFLRSLTSKQRINIGHYKSKKKGTLKPILESLKDAIVYENESLLVSRSKNTAGKSIQDLVNAITAKKVNKDVAFIFSYAVSQMIHYQTFEEKKDGDQTSEKKKDNVFFADPKTKEFVEGNIRDAVSMWEDKDKPGMSEFQENGDIQRFLQFCLYDGIIKMKTTSTIWGTGTRRNVRRNVRAYFGAKKDNVLPLKLLVEGTVEAIGKNLRNMIGSEDEINKDLQAEPTVKSTIPSFREVTAIFLAKLPEKFNDLMPSYAGEKNAASNVKGSNTEPAKGTGNVIAKKTVNELSFDEQNEVKELIAKAAANAYEEAEAKIEYTPGTKGFLDVLFEAVKTILLTFMQGLSEEDGSVKIKSKNDLQEDLEKIRSILQKLPNKQSINVFVAQQRLDMIASQLQFGIIQNESKMEPSQLAELNKDDKVKKMIDALKKNKIDDDIANIFSIAVLKMVDCDEHNGQNSNSALEKCLEEKWQEIEDTWEQRKDSDNKQYYGGVRRGEINDATREAMLKHLVETQMTHEEGKEALQVESEKYYMQLQFENMPDYQLIAPLRPDTDFLVNPRIQDNLQDCSGMECETAGENEEEV